MSNHTAALARSAKSTLSILVALALAAPKVSAAANIEAAEQLFRSGQYEKCARLAAAQIDQRVYIEKWVAWKVQAELAAGDYEAALRTVQQGVDESPFNVALRMLAYEALLYNGQTASAQAELDRLERLVIANPRRFTRPDERVWLGKLFLLKGADARQVLELFYDPVVKQWPNFAAAPLASAELALDKGDNGLAAEMLASAPDSASADPIFHYLVARAYSNDDPERASASLDRALELNPRHIKSLLLRVDGCVDAEQYSDADELLERVLEVNPRHPIAWAYKAVLSHLGNDQESEDEARRQALSTWTQNPAVDFTIGRKLSEKYRFAEGAAYQRRALKLDRVFLPARMQLSQDLLRLGDEDEGWRIVRNVFESDGYNVIAHNLVTLHDDLKSYRVLEDGMFRLRMESREASLYGEQALALLKRARSTLCEKYDVSLNEPITVEIFPQQKDFAVRTFGMPGVQGYLGVCFGNVITANSPAALGDASANWEAVLWHEFCHVATLKKTRNKMPRWLSEGISVYEELQENGTWG
ncbi:MAG: hypothetical protein AAF961_12350, partial [Planctomycetota bacterium]